MSPPPEHTLWEGRPGWRGLAFGLFRMHWVGLYFALIVLGRTGLALRAGATPGEAMPAAAMLLMLGAGCLAILALLAGAIRRTTRYTITDRRIILNYGIALPAKLAIPYGAIAEVALRMSGGSGDISLRLKPGQWIGYARLWPHARPWRLAAPQPMLRAVPDAAEVAALAVRLTQAGVERIGREVRDLRASPPGPAGNEPARASVRSALPG